MLFRNKGTEMMLIQQDSGAWEFPYGKPHIADRNLEETAVRQLFNQTGLSTRDYTLCNHKLIRLSKYGFFTAHLARGREAWHPRKPILWIPTQSWRNYTTNSLLQFWDGKITCYSV